MSLKSLYKISPQLVDDGVWFDICTNSDGSKARVRLRSSGRENPAWVTAFRKHSAGVDDETLTPEADEEITARIFVDGCLVDWENLQPDDDGKNLPFSTDNAVELLSSREWTRLLRDWQAKAGTFSHYQEKAAKKRKAEAKN